MVKHQRRSHQRGIHPSDLDDGETSESDSGDSPSTPLQARLQWSQPQPHLPPSVELHRSHSFPELGPAVTLHAAYPSHAGLSGLGHFHSRPSAIPGCLDDASRDEPPTVILYGRAEQPRSCHAQYPAATHSDTESQPARRTTRLCPEQPECLLCCFAR